MPKDRDPAFERRLDELRQAALANGRVDGRGVDIAGGPIPAEAARRQGGHGKTASIDELSQRTRREQRGQARLLSGCRSSKPPVWTWEVSALFFRRRHGRHGGEPSRRRPRGSRGIFETVRARRCGSRRSRGGILVAGVAHHGPGPPAPMFYQHAAGSSRFSRPMSMGVYILSIYGTAFHSRRAGTAGTLTVGI